MSKAKMKTKLNIGQENRVFALESMNLSFNNYYFSMSPHPILERHKGIHASSIQLSMGCRECFCDIVSILIVGDI